jgi:hypothetical protein
MPRPSVTPGEAASTSAAAAPAVADAYSPVPSVSTHGQQQAERGSGHANFMQAPDALLVASFCDPDAESWQEDSFCVAFADADISDLINPEGVLDGALLGDAPPGGVDEHLLGLSAAAAFANELAAEEDSGVEGGKKGSTAEEPSLADAQEGLNANQWQAAAAELHQLRALVEKDLQQGSLIWGSEAVPWGLHAELLPSPTGLAHT